MMCTVMEDNEEVNKVLLHITDKLNSMSEELGEENFKKSCRNSECRISLKLKGGNKNE